MQGVAFFMFPANFPHFHLACSRQHLSNGVRACVRAYVCACARVRVRA